MSRIANDLKELLKKYPDSRRGSMGLYNHRASQRLHPKSGVIYSYKVIYGLGVTDGDNRKGFKNFTEYQSHYK